MPYRLVPHPGRILIAEDGFKYEGKIIIPDNAQRRASTGTIVAIGEGTETKLTVGDRVIFPMYSGTGLRLRDPKNPGKDQPPMRVLTTEEILCRIEGDIELLEAGA